MKNRPALVLMVLAVAGCAMETDVVAADKGTSGNVKSALGNESEISDFIIKIAQTDISNLDRISGLLPGDWQLTRTSQSQKDGWIMRKAKSIESPAWFKSAALHAYVERDSVDKEKLFTADARLIIMFRNEVCFAGKAFSEPKYKRGDIMDSIRAQPRDGVGTVLLFSISGRAVDFRYEANNQCVREITFFGLRTTAGVVR